MSAIDKTKQKELAKYIFLREKNITQNELAERVGISRQTLNKWIKAGEWETLKKTLLTTRDERLTELYNELEELNKAIKEREPGARFATSKEADTRRKIVRDIKELEIKTNIREVIDVFKRFLEWYKPHHYEDAKTLSGFFDAFIKDNLK